VTGAETEPAKARYSAAPKPLRPARSSPAHYRVRHDKIDRWGAVSLRNNGRLHHINLGTRLTGTRSACSSTTCTSG
jgi:hypothetical protein